MKKDKTFFLILSFYVIVFPVFADNIILFYGVDGSSENVNVSITGRNPVIHWEYKEGITITNFEVKISTFQQGLSLSSTIWWVFETTNTFNTINNITRVECPSGVLQQQTTFWFQIKVNSETSYDEKIGWFYVTISSVVLKNNVDLKIDYNNPFCPKQGEITKIKYVVKNKDTPVKLYIFNIAGRYIKTLAEHVALKDVVYTIDWDGKDENNIVLPQGVYLAVLSTPDSTPALALISIVDKR